MHLTQPKGEHTIHRMKLPNTIKRFRKWTAPVVLLVLSLLLERLLELFLPADIKTSITLFLGIPPGLIIIAVAAILACAFIVWVIRNDDPQLPIFFGGYRLRRIAPLVFELLRTKEFASSKDTSVSITHLSLASELTRKLDQLRIEHPDLHTTHRFGDAVDDEYVKFTLVLVFLDVLRRSCLDGDLKGAQSIMSRVNSNDA